MAEGKPEYGGNYQAPYDSPGERRGMSGCTKAFLIIGGLGIAACLACCVGGWFYIRSAVVTDPAEVKQMADQIVDWEFNEELNGKFGMNMIVARVAVMGDPAVGMMLLVDSKYADPEDMSKEIEGQFETEFNSDDNSFMEETDVIERGDRDIEIQGQTYNIQFNKSRGKTSGKEYWQVLAVIPGKAHPAFIMLEVLAENYDEEEIIRRFESL